MRHRWCLHAALAAAILLPTAVCPATLIVEYAVDAGGNNPDQINGMAARATWRTEGATLTILLENASSGVPIGAEVSDWIVVKLQVVVSAIPA